MQALVWWSLPLAGFVLAIVWVSIANRPRPRANTHESVAEHERFREAMHRQTDGSGQPGPEPDDSAGLPPERPPGRSPSAP
jgi:hypothetical protein